jgi:hypothetical protein
MKLVKVPALLLLCLFASSVVAGSGHSGLDAPVGDAAPPPIAAVGMQEGAAQPSAGKGKKVCRNSVVTGSRFRQKICHTQAEWDGIEHAHKEKMRDIDRQPVGYRDP